MGFPASGTGSATRVLVSLGTVVQLSGAAMAVGPYASIHSCNMHIQVRCTDRISESLAHREGSV